MDASHTLAGYRLRAVELRNWGTFDGDRHYVLDLRCASACLTGLNGSGKSTVVDAILTLLVPHEFRNYNVAATGAGAKRERSLKTYIMGAYAKEESPESNHGQAKFLRKTGTISVLLAVFRDAVFGKDVTLAQLHWISASGEHQARYLCKESACRIGELGLANLGVSSFAAHFAKNGWSYDTSFEPYQGRFMSILRIPSNQALKLFCRTVSVKDVPSVTEFIRSLMLEPYPVAKNLDAIESHFSDLDRIHTQLEETKNEIKLLEPVAEHYGVYKQANDEAERLIKVKNAADVVLARDAAAVVDGEMSVLTEQMTGQQSEVTRLGKELKDIGDRIVEIRVSMNQNSAGAAIAALLKEEAKLSDELNQARTLLKNYTEWLCSLGRLEAVTNPAEFASTRTWATGLLQNNEGKREAALQNSGMKQAEAATIRLRASALADEIGSLQRRRDKIPESYRIIRRTICEDLGLNEGAVSFAGEMLDVLPSESAWRPSIESLLHGFALSVLVPDEHYRRFSGYVENSAFKRRLVYFKVPKGGGLTASLEISRVYGKLMIRPDTWCRGWLQERLLSDYSHLCAGNMEAFWDERGPAITQNRHVKGGIRHVKEGVQDERDMDLLGWSNESKILEMQRQLLDLQKQGRAVDEVAAGLVKQSRELTAGIKVLGLVAGVASYRAIDEKGVEAELTAATDRRREMEESDETWKTLNESLKEATTEQTLVTENRDTALNLHAALGERHGALKIRREGFGSKMNAATLREFDWKAYEADVAGFRAGEQLTLKGIERQVESVLGRINAAFARQRDIASGANSLLLPAIARFLEATKAKGYSNDWQATTASAPAMVAHLNSLVGENFHTKQKEFSEMMRKVLLDDLRVGDGDMQVQRASNADRVEELNQTLATVPYNEGTFVKIVTRPSREDAVITYRGKLEECTKHTIAMTDVQLDERFKAVKALVTYIREKRTDAEKGANPNNWDTFAIEEINPDTPDKPVNYFTDADGNSGGQKAKLACTILAAAMAFQLNHTRTRQSNAFRLVMVDEIFAKSDDVNSAFALSIFEKFDFQLLLVTPRDGRLKLVQPFVGSFHLVQNAAGRASLITSMTTMEVEAANHEAPAGHG